MRHNFLRNLHNKLRYKWSYAITESFVKSAASMCCICLFDANLGTEFGLLNEQTERPDASGDKGTMYMYFCQDYRYLYHRASAYMCACIRTLVRGQILLVLVHPPTHLGSDHF